MKKAEVRLTMFASTAPPKKTICLLLGGSSILTLNFYRRISSVENESPTVDLRLASLDSQQAPSSTTAA
jgi:hypothetical protein